MSHKTLSQQFEDVKRWAEGLPVNVAMVGWFSANAAKAVPLSHLEITILYKSKVARMYPNIKNPIHSAMVSNLPVVYLDGHIRIGGKDLYYKWHKGQRVYSTRPSAQVKPVGRLFDLYSTQPRRLVTMVFDEREDVGRAAHCRRVLLQLGKMLKQTTDSVADFKSPEKAMHMPQFLVPQTKSGKLRLRRGRDLDKRVLDCAITGNWATALSCSNLTEYLTYERGTATFDGKRVKLEMEGQTIRELEYMPNVASIQIEERVQDIFGVQLGVQLLTLLPQNIPTRVKQYQTLFAPIPRKDWTMGELKNLPNYETLEYLAALSTMREINGVAMLDFTVARGPDEPWAYMGDMPWTIQAVENRSLKTYKSVGRDHPLLFDEGLVHFNLLDIPIKTFYHDLSMKLRQERENEAKMAQSVTKLESGNKVEPTPAPIPSAVPEPAPETKLESV